MKDEIKQPSDEQIIVALAHLSMLTQSAKGVFKMLPEDAETRQAWLSAFIRTGQGILSEEDLRFARLINNFLSTQSVMLNTQFVAPATEPDAARE